MDLNNLFSNYHLLLEQMERDGYSQGYIKAIEWEIKWIKRHPELHDCNTYLELCEKRVASGRKPCSSQDRIYHKYSMFTVLQQFDENGDFPNHHHKTPLVKRAAYYHLNDYYQSIVDSYRAFAEEKKYAEQSTEKCISKTSCFLLHVQNLGNKTLKTVTETDVISFFTDCEGKLIRSRSYKRDIEAVLGSDLGNLSSEGNRVRLLLPAIRRKRKNIQYLTDEESICICKALENRDGLLCKRDLAIGMLLYYTGMRAGDVADLRLDEIDWESEQIIRLQGKTGYPIELPMDINVGNAIYDYIVEERPNSQDTHVFLWKNPPYLPINSDVIWPITARIYKAAAIRQKSGDRRGSHLFRHHVATHLAEKGIPQPVISEILGHEDPGSLNHYLSADIEHLRECALSLEPFPVEKGVFRV